MDKLLEILEQLKQENDVEYVKVYYANPQNYSIKFIKDECVMKRIKRGSAKFDIKRKA